MCWAAVLQSAHSGFPFFLNLGIFCCGHVVPLHTLSNRESAWHLIHLERDLERDPDLELEELRERDLEDKKETEPFQYFPQHEPQLHDLVVCHGTKLLKLKKPPQNPERNLHIRKGEFQQEYTCGPHKYGKSLISGEQTLFWQEYLCLS